MPTNTTTEMEKLLKVLQGDPALPPLEEVHEGPILPEGEREHQSGVFETKRSRKPKSPKSDAK